MKHNFAGQHLLAEFYGIRNAAEPPADLDSFIARCCSAANAGLIEVRTAPFDGGGYTAYALLKESHLAIHTYHECNAAFIDVFTCGNMDCQVIIDMLNQYYAPARISIQRIERGQEG